MQSDSCRCQLTYLSGHARPSMRLPGEHTWMVTPVPIPNTAVKHPGPMVVSLDARVGHRREFDKTPPGQPGGVFACAAGAASIFLTGAAALTNLRKSEAPIV